MYHRTTDQTEAFADTDRYTVNNQLEWLFETPEERFITIKPYEYRDETETHYIDSRYRLTGRKAFDSQDACMTAWEERQFPTHNVSRSGPANLQAELYSSDNFRAFQHSDGTGRVEHYDTLAAIRTRDGTVINNSQDFGTGFARITRASDSEGTVPLTTIRESGVLPDGMDLYDITGFFRSEKLTTSYSGGYELRNAKPELVTLSDGSGLVIVKDESAKNHHENTAMFHVSEDEIKAAETVAELELLLVPKRVKESGLEIVPTNEMAPHRGRSGESRYDDRGKVIQRQGEWYFIPVGDLQHATVKSDLPKKCRCGASRFDVSETETVCKECGYRYLRPGHVDAETPLGNHEPTQYVEPPGNSAKSIATDGGTSDEDEDEETDEATQRIAGYVRGTVRHSEEHYMARLGDDWHLAVRHTRDCVVIDTSTQSGRSGFRRERRRRWD